MKTSYYKRTSDRKIKGCVRVSATKPKWYPDKLDLEEYKDLFPLWETVKKGKEHSITHREYAQEFYDTILKNLDPKKVFEDLKDKIILCWCKSGKFCHRRIIAKWLQLTIGEKIEELE